MNNEEFLKTVITAEEGWFCLGIASPSGEGFWEEWYYWPQDFMKILNAAEKYREEYNVYFSTYLFTAQRSTKENVVKTRTIQADLDEADVNAIPLEPTILVESSPGRHQAYWVLKSEADLEEHEILSKKVTYSIPNCDHSGWPLGRKLRLPNTFNYKYLEGPKAVTVKTASLKKYEVAEVELLPESDAPAKLEFDWLESEIAVPDIGPQELLESIKDKISAKVYSSYNVVAKDRSATLWALMCAAFRAGLSREAVFHLARNSANNKFATLRFNGDRELAKDILRAEQVVKNNVPNTRSSVYNARMTKGIAYYKRDLMLGIILRAMQAEGEFIRTTDDNIWYIRRDLGRPIIISRHSEYLDMILDLEYGVNASEIEQSFITAGLASYARNLPVSAVTGALSHYDIDTNSIILHTGKKTIFRITKDNIDKGVNGAFGVVFPWITSNEPFAPNMESKVDWADELFGGCLDNTIEFDKEEALTVLKVWFLFLLFRSAAVSRPILSLFGQPGSGKSTLFRRIYAILYGRQRSLGAVTTPDDFDHSVSVDPLVVLDNVDTWEKWLPDRLALSASTSDITKRKLYTDIDTITLKRQALVGITAHNPKFGREDVADRLLLISFHRLEHFIPEGDIINKLLEKRNDIWGAIIRDIQLVLQVANPPASECPQFRVEDFARVGYRISKALELCDQFRSGLRRVYIGQRLFSLEEEQLLVSAIQSMLTRKKNKGSDNHVWYSMANLWSELELASSDPNTFQKSYRNAIFLGKKLWALQESLKEVFNINWKQDKDRGSRVWQIALKENGGNTVARN